MSMSVTDSGLDGIIFAFSNMYLKVPPDSVPAKVKLPDVVKLPAVTFAVAVSLCALYIPSDMSLAMLIVDPYSLRLCLAPT